MRKRKRREWTSGDLGFLHWLIEQRYAFSIISECLNRTEQSCKWQAFHRGWSVRAERNKRPN